MDDDTERRIKALEDKVSELITEHNLMSGYIETLRNDLAKHLTYPWYRFIVWLWPLPLPPYARRVVVNGFRKRDRRPVVRQETTSVQPVRSRKPRLPASEQVQ